MWERRPTWTRRSQVLSDHPRGLWFSRFGCQQLVAGLEEIKLVSPHPQTTYPFDMFLHAKIITLASNLKKKKSLSSLHGKLAYASEAIIMSLTPTLECGRGLYSDLPAGGSCLGACQHPRASTIPSPHATCKTEIFLGFPEKKKKLFHSFFERL